MPKLTLALDSSQIVAAKKCHHMWALAYREGYTLPEPASYLQEGTLMHALLDIYYTTIAINPKINPYTAAKIGIENLTKYEVFSQYHNVEPARWEFLCHRFLQYVAKWHNTDFMPIRAGKQIGVELGFSKTLFESDKYHFIVEGRVDLLSVVSGQLVFIDHKTQGTAASLYGYKPQFLTYAWATGAKIGVVNYIRLHQKYDEKFTLMRDTINFQDWMIEEWKEEMLELFINLARVIETTGGDVEKFKRERANCGGAFDRAPCMFTPICEVQSLVMREQIKTSKFVKQPVWRPW